MKVERPLPRKSCMRSHSPFPPPCKGDHTHAVSPSLHTTLLPLTVLVHFLAAPGFNFPASARAGSSAIHFDSSPLCNICGKDMDLYTSYSHGELAGSAPSC